MQELTGEYPAAAADQTQALQLFRDLRAALNPDGTLDGHIYFHLGDDSAFRAERT